jgi:hypothetical protein
MSKFLVQISWCCGDENGDFMNDSSSNDTEYVADIATGKIYDEYEDIGDLDDPYYFTAVGVSESMRELISMDNSFLTDELSEKWLIPAIKQQITEPKFTNGNIFTLNWKKPNFGEVTLVYEVESFQCNHPQDPVEWDTTIDCVGALGLNYDLVETELS